MPKGKGKGFSVSMLFFTNQSSNDDRESTRPSSTPSVLGSLLPLGPWNTYSLWHPGQTTADFPVSCDSCVQWLCLIFPPNWNPMP